MLLQDLTSALHKATNHSDLRSVMEYATLPPGKLFRSQLIQNLAQDLDHRFSDDHLHLALAIEFHHSYTLIHDDLPSMDNDLVRRGKPTTHAQYGEWRAILAGDALLIQSFHELHKITHPEVSGVLRLFTWATGAKGLIAGQFADLALEGVGSIEQIIRIHELKTARLIQASTLGAYLLSAQVKNLKMKKDFLRLGREIGLIFQLMDDLSDLTQKEISVHEKAINPFILAPEEALSILRITHLRLKKLLEENQLAQASSLLQNYFKQLKNELSCGLPQIEKKSEMKFWTKDLETWLTSFA